LNIFLREHFEDEINLNCILKFGSYPADAYSQCVMMLRAIDF